MLSVIVVDYRSLGKTIKYISELTNQIVSDEDIHFIIVDNYSENTDLCVIEDNNLKYVGVTNELGKRLYHYEINGKEVVYVYSGGNVGYAKGNNLGMRVSELLFKDAYYLVSNNDIAIENAIDISLIQRIFDNMPSVAVIGPKVIGLDGIPQSPNRKPDAFGNLVLTYFSMATHDKLFKWNDVDYTGESKICYRVMGSFVFLRASAMADVGMYDENTFMFAEEMILSERMLKRGYETYFYDDITVIHVHGESVDRIADRSEPVKWSHESVSYYFREYRDTSRILLAIGNLTCKIYIALYRFKKEMIKASR